MDAVVLCDAERLPVWVMAVIADCCAREEGCLDVHYAFKYFRRYWDLSKKMKLDKHFAYIFKRVEVTANFVTDYPWKDLLYFETELWRDGEISHEIGMDEGVLFLRTWREDQSCPGEYSASTTIRFPQYPPPSDIWEPVYCMEISTGGSYSRHICTDTDTEEYRKAVELFNMYWHAPKPLNDLK